MDRALPYPVEPGKMTVWKPGMWGGCGRENSMGECTQTRIRRALCTPRLQSPSPPRSSSHRFFSLQRSLPKIFVCLAKWPPRPVFPPIFSLQRTFKWFSEFFFEEFFVLEFLLLLVFCLGPNGLQGPCQLGVLAGLELLAQARAHGGAGAVDAAVVL